MNSSTDNVQQLFQFAPYDVNQVELIASLCDELTKQHPQGVAAEPHVMNACIRAADIVVEACKRPAVKSVTADAWLSGNDTCASSRYMLSKLHQGKAPLEFEYDHPIDTSDLARCIHMFRAVGFKREALQVMRNKSLVWAEIVLLWDQLVAAYDDGRNKDLECLLSIALSKR